MKQLRQFCKQLVVASLVGLMLLLAPAVALAAPDTKTAVCEGVGIASSSGCDDTTGVDVQAVIRNVIQFLVVIVGSIAVIMFIVGGFKYITSGGDSNKTASAKNTLLFATIGVVVVLLAQFLVSFVITEADKANTTAPPQSQQGTP